MAGCQASPERAGLVRARHGRGPVRDGNESPGLVSKAPVEVII
jgi:hypothetical protein